MTKAATPSLPVGTHFLIYVALYFAGGALGFIVGWLLVSSLTETLESIHPAVRVLIVLLPIIIGAYVPRLSFARLVPAKCPTCSGPAYLMWPSRPITYVCVPSGHRYSTGLRLGR